MHKQRADDTWCHMQSESIFLDLAIFQKPTSLIQTSISSSHHPQTSSFMSRNTTTMDKPFNPALLVVDFQEDFCPPVRLFLHLILSPR